MVKRLAWLIALGILVLITGCSVANYAGTGNEFSIEATITEASSDAVRITNVQLGDTSGLAKDWFDGSYSIWSGKDRRLVHNNYYTGEFLNSHKYVGQAYDKTGKSIPLESVPVGSKVRLSGAIRDSATDDDTEQRAVFARLDILPQ